MQQLPAPPKSKPSIWKKVLIVVGAVFLLGVVLNALGVGEQPTSQPSSETVTSSEWDEFPSGLRPSIDAYAAEGDCQGLQDTFDTVDLADGAHPDILRYIDGKMRDADCY